MKNWLIKVNYELPHCAKSYLPLVYKKLTGPRLQKVAAPRYNLETFLNNFKDIKLVKASESLIVIRLIA